MNYVSSKCANAEHNRAGARGGHLHAMNFAIMYVGRHNREVTNFPSRKMVETRDVEKYNVCGSSLGSVGGFEFTTVEYLGIANQTPQKKTNQH